MPDLNDPVEAMEEKTEEASDLVKNLKSDPLTGWLIEVPPQEINVEGEDLEQ